MDALRVKLAGIEAALDAGCYRPGPWETFVRLAREQPVSKRAALAVDVSRVSAKLHRRNGRHTLPVTRGVALELAATAAGGVFLGFGLTRGSTAAVLLAVVIWVTTFQPLVKMIVGTLLGVRYDYAYLLGIEPRFKMRYGTYLAAPQWARIVLHLSGMVGSPLAAWVVAFLTRPRLVFASVVCDGIFWAVLLLNTALLVAGFAGVRRLGSLRLATSSGGVAGSELRAALAGRR